MKGFTIIELMIVFLLVAILIVAGGLFSFNQTIRGQEMIRARDLIRSELARAEAQAMTGTSAWGVRFDAHQLTRFEGSSFAGRNASSDAPTTFSNTVTISGATDIIFNTPEGVPATSGVITITEGTRTVTISVNAAGAISVN